MIAISVALLSLAAAPDAAPPAPPVDVVDDRRLFDELIDARRETLLRERQTIIGNQAPLWPGMLLASIGLSLGVAELVLANSNSGGWTVLSSALLVPAVLGTVLGLGRLIYQAVWRRRASLEVDTIDAELDQLPRPRPR